MSKYIKHDDRVTTAAIEYLLNTDKACKILDVYNGCYWNFNIIDIVAISEDDELIFAQVRRYDDYSPQEIEVKPFSHKKRMKFEKDAFDWLLWNDDYLDVPFRFDIIDVFVMPSEDRAVLRHNVNAGAEK